MTDTAFRIWWWTRAAKMSGKSVPSKPVTFCLSPRLQHVKVRSAINAQNDGLAIDDEMLQRGFRQFKDIRGRSLLLCPT